MIFWTTFLAFYVTDTKLQHLIFGKTHFKHRLRLPPFAKLPRTCAALMSHLSFSPEKWSLTRAVLATNPPGAVLKRHRSNVDRNTFIGIVSPFKRRLVSALPATGHCGWLRRHSISISPAPLAPAPAWRPAPEPGPSCWAGANAIGRTPDFVCCFYFNFFLVKKKTTLVFVEHVVFLSSWC